MQEGLLIVLSGPAGSGKGTVSQLLLRSPEFAFSVSATTRAPRPGEVDGVNYHFISVADFEERIRRGELLEYTNYCGNYYGTPKQLVIDKLKEGIDVVLEIDIQGAMKVKENYPDGIFIFILPPSMSELRKRITGRGTETEDAINLRLSKTLSEISYIDKYDYCVVNGLLEEAVSRVKSIIVAEHSRVAEDVRTLIERYEEEI